MPADATRVHYEGELVVVIGKRMKHCLLYTSRCV